MPNILKSPCLVKLYDGTEIIIPGLCKNSDFTTPIAYIKTHATNLLLKNQSLGDNHKWLSDDSNFTLK